MGKSACLNAFSAQKDLTAHHTPSKNAGKSTSSAASPSHKWVIAEVCTFPMMPIQKLLQQDTLLMYWGTHQSLYLYVWFLCVFFLYFWISFFWTQERLADGSVLQALIVAAVAPAFSITLQTFLKSFPGFPPILDTALGGKRRTVCSNYYDLWHLEAHFLVHPFHECLFYFIFASCCVQFAFFSQRASLLAALPWLILSCTMTLLFAETKATQCSHTRIEH